MKAFTYPGNIYIVTGPSGAGKSTLLRRLIQEDANLQFSVSHTTRQPRKGEVDGVDYHFTDVTTFQNMIAADAFLEWAEVHSNYYGTSKAQITQRLEQGGDVVVDVDVQGGLLIKKALPSACSIFILPPHFQALRDRLEKRGKDSKEVIARRLQNASKEVPIAVEYDFALVNDDLHRCYKQLKHVVTANRLRSFRQKSQLARILDTFS